MSKVEVALQTTRGPLPREAFEQEADLLSARVKAFEQAVASLPCRIPFEYKRKNENDGLKLERSSSKWQLVYLTKYYVKARRSSMEFFLGLQRQQEEEWEEIPLSQTSLRNKAHAVMMFNEFLKGMATEYDRTQQEVIEANRELESAEATLRSLEQPESEGL